MTTNKNFRVKNDLEVLGSVVASGVFYEHGHTVTSDHSMAPGSNALSLGPITINAGVAVTIPTGSLWRIL